MTTITPPIVAGGHLLPGGLPIPCDRCDRVDTEADPNGAILCPDHRGPIHIVFTGEPPDLVFVEVERPLGTSVNVGSWSTDERGYKVLTVPAEPPQETC
jgi:hypothetical protein